MATHALVTGPISGRILVADHPDGHVDVTPDVLYFEHDDETTPPVLVAVAHAIEDEHYVRGTHPVDLACKALDDPSQYKPEDVTAEMRKAHRAEHKALHAKMADRGVTR